MNAFPNTVSDFVATIANSPGGRFTEGFREDGRCILASIYGAPFFALNQFSESSLHNAGASILVADPGGMLGADGGRWLSLYSKVASNTKFSCTVCASSRPQSLRPPKPLLFQPPQQVLVKSWIKHLRDLDTPPDAFLLYVPDGFDEIESAIDALCEHTQGRMTLLASHSRAEAALVQWLLRQRKCETSEIVGFQKDEGTPQDFAAGAWWLSTIPPAAEQQATLTGEAREAVARAYSFFRGYIRQAKGREAAAKTAAVFAKRTTEIVAGEENIRAVRLSPMGGIDLASGRFFSKPEEDAEFDWEEHSIDSDLLGDLPEEAAEFTTDENHYRLMEWVAKSCLEEHRRSAEDRDPPSLDEVAPVDPVQEVPQANATAAPVLPQGAEPAPDTGKTAVPAEEAATRPRRSRLSRNAGTVNVLALAAMLGKPGHSSSKSFDAAKSRILAWLGSKGFAVPDPSSNSYTELSDGELTIETDGQAIWAMRFDDRRSMEDGAIWRVEATLLGNDASPALSLRLVQVRSSEDAPPPVASGVPGVVASIAKEVGLQDAGAALRNNAMRINGSKDAAWLSNLLLNAHRSQPVILISGDVDVSADRLAARLAGVAHVVCVDRTATNQLIHQFGRDRAVFGSAVRLYRPGFNADSNPYQHPIWALKGTQLPKWLTNDIFEEACAISLEVGDLDDRAPSFQTVRNLLSEQRMADSEKRIRALREQAESQASTAEERIKRLEAIRIEQDSALEAYRTENRQLGEQSKQLQSELQTTRRERDEALEEARQLRYQINNQWADETISGSDQDESYYPDNWDELELWVDEYGEGKLILHEKALKAVKSSPFRDIPFAYKALEYLVRYFVPMKQRAPGDDAPFQAEINALKDLGLEREPVGEALNNHRYKQSYRRLYEGKTIWLDNHLKWGGGFDPATLFRLYFHYDEAGGKVIVGHLTTHLPNSLTHTS